MHIIYLHGFLSSPASHKAQTTGAWLAAHRPDIRFSCPELSSYPDKIRSHLIELLTGIDEKPHLIGSSLGGYWASYLVESGLAQKAVVINPAVSPHVFFSHYVGQELKGYYSDHRYTLNTEHLNVLAECESASLNFPEKYWLMVQRGDEVLDYRLACERYRDARQLVEDGGNHTFENYDRWLPDIVDFFESATRK